MKTQSHDEQDDMQPEYDFSGGVRGKYVARTAAGSNLVLLEPDVAQTFLDSVSVNEALRQLLIIARRARAETEP